jgi:hypothetical protein
MSAFLTGDLTRGLLAQAGGGLTTGGSAGGCSQTVRTTATIVFTNSGPVCMTIWIASVEASCVGRC